MEEELFELLRQMLPPAFRGPDIGKMSGGIFHWETVQNLRSQGEYPADCFTRLGDGGAATIVYRDKFLDAAKERASRAKAAKATNSRSPRGRRPRGQQNVGGDASAAG